MRIPTWVLTGWVLLALIGGAAGAYGSYTQSRERTRELDNIASLEEGVNPVDVVGLLAGWQEPELPDSVEAQAPPTTAPVAQAPVSTSTPISDDPATTADSGVSDTDDAQEPAITQSPVPTAVAETSSVQSIGVRRINVLLMGIDQRVGETGPFTTDTMMLLSLSPATRSGVMLSIPRDIYVSFPLGLGRGKINTANIVGELQQYPDGGAAYAKRTVQEFLGVPVHYYVMINFTAFLEIMEVVGPVEICIDQPIDDPDYPDGSYGTRPVYFEAGCQDLPPDRLLEYSRTRATANGDIDRAARQQQVMLAVQDKIVSVTGVTSLLTNALPIWESVSANISTDLTFQEIVNLAGFMSEVSQENIVNTTIGYDRVEIGTSPEGEDVLIPIRSDIVALVSELFGAP